MPARVQSVAELAVQVTQDAALQNAIKADPAGAIANLAAPLQSDVWIYRIVVVVLGLVVLGTVAGAIGLTAYGKEIPQVLTALGSAAVGALAGLLGPSPAASR